MKKTAKITSFVLCFLMVLALAVPAFAKGVYDAPEIRIINESKSGAYPSGTVVKYELKLFGSGADTIKVGSKSLTYKDFKKNADDSYSYTGSVLVTKNTSLKFTVKDMKMDYSKYEFTKTYSFKVDSSLPLLQAYTEIMDGIALKPLYISIFASDTSGLQSIKVNNKTVADEKDLKDKTFFNAVYGPAAAGTYIITVTDKSGNASVGYVKYKDGKVETDIPEISEVGASIAKVGIYEKMLPALKDNPLLYYLFKEDGTVDNDFLLYYQLLQNKDSENKYSELYYWLLMNKGGQASETEKKDDNKDYLLYYLLSDKDAKIDPALLYSLFGSGKETDKDNFLWYLINSADGSDSDKSLLYRYLLNGQSTGNNDYLWSYLLSGSEKMDPALFYLLNGTYPFASGQAYSKDFLFYEYYIGSALNFTNGAKIGYTTKDGKMTMTAPAVADPTYVEYQWQKTEADKNTWKNISGATSAELTVTPVKGEKYKVVYSSDFYYTTKESDALTVTEEMLKDTETSGSEEKEEDKKEESKKITSDDIVISGLGNYNYISIKVGATVPVSVNYPGYWSVSDPSLISGLAGSYSIFKTLKTGTALITYTAFGDNNDTATKSYLVVITDK